MNLDEFIAVLWTVVVMGVGYVAGRASYIKVNQHWHILVQACNIEESDNEEDEEDEEDEDDNIEEKDVGASEKQDSVAEINEDEDDDKEEEDDEEEDDEEEDDEEDADEEEDDEEDADSYLQDDEDKDPECLCGECEFDVPPPVASRIDGKESKTKANRNEEVVQDEKQPESAENKPSDDSKSILMENPKPCEMVQEPCESSKHSRDTKTDL
jgi:hypothetical protein